MISVYFEKLYLATWIVGLGLFALMFFLMHPWQLRVIRRFRAGRQMSSSLRSPLPAQIERYDFPQCRPHSLLKFMLITGGCLFLIFFIGDIIVFLSVIRVLHFSITEDQLMYLTFGGIVVSFLFGMPLVFLADGRFLINIDVTDRGIIYQYPSCSIEHIPWDKIQSIRYDAGFSIETTSYGIIKLSMGFEGRIRSLKEEISKYTEIIDTTKYSDQEVKRFEWIVSRKGVGLLVLLVLCGFMIIFGTWSSGFMISYIGLLVGIILIGSSLGLLIAAKSVLNTIPLEPSDDGQQ